MYNPKVIKKEKAKRHFKRLMNRDVKNGALVKEKRLQYGYNHSLRRLTKMMFPNYDWRV